MGEVLTYAFLTALFAGAGWLLVVAVPRWCRNPQTRRKLVGGLGVLLLCGSGVFWLAGLAVLIIQQDTPGGGIKNGSVWMLTAALSLVAGILAVRHR